MDISLTNLLPISENSFKIFENDVISDLSESQASMQIYLNNSSNAKLVDNADEKENIDPQNNMVFVESNTENTADQIIFNDNTEQTGENNGNSASNEKILTTKTLDNNQGRPKKGRKRKFPSQNREIRKMKCIHNETYITVKGKTKLPKEFRQFLCQCACLERVSVQKAREEYDKFYAVDSYDAQRALICAMVRECPVKRKQVKGSDKKKFSREYSVNGVVVCKAFFLQTFRVSSGKVDLALKGKKRPEGIKDLRGINGGKNKVSEEQFKQVKNHIDKFPKYKSHYSSAKTECKYLRSDTTLPVMYNLYKQESKFPVSFSKYKDIFLTCFNLKRKPLKKDTCNRCDKLEVLKTTGNNEEQNKYKLEKERHLSEADEARNLLNTNRKQAVEDVDLEVLCFDMEKTLPLPRIPTNVVFYKRQLWLYNLGIHTAKKNKGHCYLWLEGEAGRGAQEVSSCLYKHIMEDQDMHSCKYLILWSDSCGGQNRNVKVVLMLKAVLEAHPLLEKITMRFLVSGHSFLPNDTDFGDIECALKLQQRLYSPDDYINIMEACRKKNPLIVHKMHKEDFFGTVGLEKCIVNRKADIDNKKINWLHIREIEILKEHPFKIFVKTDFASSAQEIDIAKKRGRPSTLEVPKFNTLLQKLWPNGKPVPEKKLEDLKCLMTFIPNDAKKFYKNLIGDANIEDNLDGFIGPLDFDSQEDENV